MMAIWLEQVLQDPFRILIPGLSERANGFVVTARKLRPTIIGFVEKAAFFWRCFWWWNCGQKEFGRKRSVGLVRCH